MPVKDLIKHPQPENGILMQDLAGIGTSKETAKITVIKINLDIETKVRDNWVVWGKKPKLNQINKNIQCVETKRNHQEVVGQDLSDRALETYWKSETWGDFDPDIILKRET